MAPCSDRAACVNNTESVMGQVTRLLSSSPSSLFQDIEDDKKKEKRHDDRILE